jgi:uncharacterized membrane protein YdbT with pleckstrin-like domain
MAREKEQWSLMPGETLIVRTRPYIRDAIKWYLYLAIPTIGITAVLALIAWLYYKAMDIQWVLTNRRLVVAKGWLTRRSTTIALEKVQEVNRSQSFFGRHLFHQLTLSIETAATVGTTVIAPVETTDQLPAELEAAVHAIHTASAPQPSATAPQPPPTNPP